MKKLFYFLFLMILSCGSVIADDAAEALNFFNDYVNAANSYNDDYFSYYSDNAKIVRIVEKPDGTEERVDIPLERYKKEARKSLILAKLRRYKNKYLNISVSKKGEDYRISADRMPSTSDYQIPAEFIVGKDSSGEWKIKEEYLNTKVQSFLNAE